MNAPDPCCDEGSIVEAPEAADFQRPTLSTVDPRGGFTHDPEFVIAGSIDNGNNWNSRSGNHRNQFTC